MNIEEKVTCLIEEPIQGLGYELFRVKLLNNYILQVMIDKEGGVSIDDCAKATRLISNILYVENLSEDLSLEVSSPGIDRPLLKREHFKKHIGKEVKLNTFLPVEGQKRFSGVLKNFDSSTDKITICFDNKEITVDFEQVQSAKLKY